MAWYTLLDYSPNFGEAGYAYYIPVYSISNPLLYICPYFVYIAENDDFIWICSPSMQCSISCLVKL